MIFGARIVLFFNPDPSPDPKISLSSLLPDPKNFRFFIGRAFRGCEKNPLGGSKKFLCSLKKNF